MSKLKPREKMLAGIVLAVIVVGFGYDWCISTFYGPFQARFDELARLTKSVQTKEDQQLAQIRARKTLKEAKLISLPPDGKKQKRPDAQDAQRYYQKWVTDLAELCEFENIIVRPTPMTLRANTSIKGAQNIYMAVPVHLEAEATYDHVIRFLDLFYRTSLLHRIKMIKVTPKEHEGNPEMKVAMDAEGLALFDVPPRAWLFPETELSGELSEDATELEVKSIADFPEKTEFRIRIKKEFLTVTKINGSKWTVQRGIDRTSAAKYSAGTQVELVQQLDGTHDMTPDEIRNMIASNIFVKPNPPYKLKMNPVTERPFARNKTVEFTIGVTGYDTLGGKKPVFELPGAGPTGLKLERNGKVTWKPDSDAKDDKYSFKIRVQHPSVPDALLETVTIRLRDVRPEPKLADTKTIPVYLNRSWNYKPKLSGVDPATSKFAWKLGDRAPAGLTVDSSTGELTWTPPDSLPPGEMTIPLVLTDNDTPPQSTTISLKIDLQDDEASYTRLIGIFKQIDQKHAYLFDPSRNKKTELSEGDEFTVANITGTVKQIGKKYVIMKMGKKDVRVDVGETLRDAETRSREYE